MQLHAVHHQEVVDLLQCEAPSVLVIVSQRSLAHVKVAALHKENQGNSLYHAHYIVNSVNGKDGKLYHSGRSELKQLAMHVHEVTGNYCRGYMKKPDEK